MKTLCDERLEASPELGQGPCGEGADIDRADPDASGPVQMPTRTTNGAFSAQILLESRAIPTN
jgi:hypothetical protein